MSTIGNGKMTTGNNDNECKRQRFVFNWNFLVNNILEVVISFLLSF